MPAPVVVTPKPKRSSRTLILNGATIAAGALVAVGDLVNVARENGIPLPDDVLPWVMMAIGAANWWLRTRTGQPLEGTKTARELGAT